MTTANHKIIRLKELLKILGVSRAGIYAKLDPKSPNYDQAFPKRIKLGQRSVGWSEAEIQQWIEGRINARRSGD